MYQRKTRRFRRRSNGRNRLPINNSQVRMRPNSFSNGQSRNNFRQSLSADKLFEKYTALAKEAMSSGEKTLSENYLQHADHFMRIVNFKNLTQTQNKSSETDVDKNKIEETAIKENNSVSNELSENKK